MARFGERGFKKLKAKIRASFYSGIPDRIASDMLHLHHVPANSYEQFALQQMPHA
jgi:hypothetical protein